jgi:hypothetical protein
LHKPAHKEEIPVSKLSGLVLAVLAAAVLVGAGPAGAVLIDFETFPDSTPVPGGTEITNQYQSEGVVFSSVPSGGASLVTNIIDFVPTTSGSNSLAPGGPAPQNGGTLILDFVVPVTSVGSFFVDDQFPVQVTAFDSLSNIVGTDASDGTIVGFDSWLIASAGGISRVELVGGYFSPTSPDGWAIDDLAFEPIPEPNAAVLFGVGSLVVAAVMRRRARAS